MSALAKSPWAIGAIAAIALTTSVADARAVKANRFGGAHASVSAPSDRSSYTPGAIIYGAGINPYPNGYGGTTSSADFQLIH